MRQFFQPAEAPFWLGRVLRSIHDALSDPWPTPLKLASYAVADLPPAADWTGGMAYVTNETGGAIPAFSDGTNWRRVSDRAVVS